MLTVLLIALPLFSALMVWVMGNAMAKRMALLFALVELALTCSALFQFEQGAAVQFLADIPWVPSMGIRFKAGMDGISLLLVLLTNVLVPLIVLSSFGREIHRASAYYGLILLMQSALIGVFTAQDGFMFYVFWELALIPIWLICLRWGSGDQIGKITLKFFAYTLAGSLLMLAALIYVYLRTENVILENGVAVSRNFSLESLYIAGSNLSSAEQAWIFWAIFIAFAIKMPVFPFHTWQPDTYVSAPTQGTMLLSGIMLKMGTYGVIRWLLPVVPDGAHQWADVAIILAVIGILYASAIAIMQKDLKRLFAYSSMAHVGLIAAGIFSMNLQGLQGGIMQMLAHGVNVVGLFFITDILMNRTRTNEIGALGGIRNIAPALATTYMIVMLGSVALPITNGFVGEFLLLNGLYQFNAYLAATAGISVILGAVYMLRSYQRTMLGETNALTSHVADLNSYEKWVLIPIVVLIFIMGVYPKPLLTLAEPSLLKLIEQIQPALPL